MDLNLTNETTDYQPKYTVHPLPLQTIMGDEWKGWKSWFDSCKEYHDKKRLKKTENSSNNSDSSNSINKKKQVLDKYNGMSLAERLNIVEMMDSEEDTNSNVATEDDRESIVSSITTHTDVTHYSDVVDNTNNCKLKPGSLPIKNPDINNNIRSFIQPDDPPLFLENGELNTHMYEQLMDRNTTCIINEPNIITAVGERVEERTKYYKHKETGKIITARHIVRIMPKSIMMRRNWQPFGEATYDQTLPNISRYGDKVHMEYSESYLQNQIDRNVLNMKDIKNIMEPIHMMPNAMSSTNMADDLKIYNAHVATNIKSAKTNDTIKSILLNDSEPVSLYIRAANKHNTPSPTPSNMSFNKTEHQQNVDTGNNKRDGTFVPAHMRRRQTDTRQFGMQQGPSFDNISRDMAPSERRRLIRQQENRDKRNGRGFIRQTQQSTNQRSRLNSVQSTGSNSGQYGLRLYNFQSLEEFDHNDIRELMNRNGIMNMSRITIPKNRATGKNRNFAFVNFNTEDDADNALAILQALDRITFDHVSGIKVQKAKQST